MFTMYSSLFPHTHHLGRGGVDGWPLKYGLMAPSLCRCLVLPLLGLRVSQPCGDAAPVRAPTPPSGLPADPDEPGAGARAGPAPPHASTEPCCWPVPWCACMRLCTAADRSPSMPLLPLSPASSSTSSTCSTSSMFPCSDAPAPSASDGGPLGMWYEDAEGECARMPWSCTSAVPLGSLALRCHALTAGGGALWCSVGGGVAATGRGAVGGVPVRAACEDTEERADRERRSGM
mmetsp:Transcript_25696/g.65274  ORF Transcript_25696/g.65274 Transcript_25696/m.65274 type:complete len:233 (+) Transcript_25696:112-810(+)